MENSKLLFASGYNSQSPATASLLLSQFICIFRRKYRIAVSISIFDKRHTETSYGATIITAMEKMYKMKDILKVVNGKHCRFP